jgi:tyrosyl-tRNA synthetase
MDEFELMRRLEVDIDELLLSSNPEVADLGERARQALKNRNLQEAQKYVMEGKEKKRPLRLAHFLVNKRVVVSVAEARRLVANGGVLVDNRSTANADLDVQYATSIKIRGVEYLPQ